MVEVFRQCEVLPQFQRNMDHFFFFGDHLGSSCHARQVMSCIAMIALNISSVLFSHTVSFFGKHLGKGFPVIRIEDSFFAMF